MDLAFVLFELVWGILLLEVGIRLYRNNEMRRFWEVMISIPYGFILEYLTIQGFSAYSYGTQFALMIGKVPISIGFMWAVVIYWSMELSQKIKTNSLLTIIIAAYIAMTFDLVLDPVAVRVGWWTWGLGLTEHWFGVMVGNFYGWLFVVSYYAGIVNFLPKETSRRFWHLIRAGIAALLSIPLLLGSVFVSKELLSRYQPNIGGLIIVIFPIIIVLLMMLLHIRLYKAENVSVKTK